MKKSIRDWLFVGWLILLPLYAGVWNDTWINLILICSVVTLKGLKNILNPVNISLLFFYLLSIVGIFYSDYPLKGQQLLYAQLPFLLVPCYFLRKEKKIKLQFISIVICLSTFSLGLFLFIKSLSIALQNLDLTQLFYVNFAPATRFYPTFNSLFTSFSLIILFSSFKKEQSLFRGGNLFCLISLLFIGLLHFCMDSKAGTIAEILIVFYFAIMYIRKGFSYKKLLIIPALVFMFVNIFIASPRNLMMLDSFKNDKGVATSTSHRILFIKAATKTIPTSLPWGEGSYGKNSTKKFSENIDELLPEFPAHEVLPNALKRSNAHNQYLDSLLQHGILGLSSLLLLLGALVYVAIKNKDSLILLIILVLSFYFAVEGILMAGYGARFVAILIGGYIYTCEVSGCKLQALLSIRDEFAELNRRVKFSKSMWDIQRLSVLGGVGLLLMGFVLTNDIIISYSDWESTIVSENRITYIPWFVITFLVYFIRTFVGVVRKEKSKKWVFYVILLLFQPLMIIFYM